MPSKNKNYVLDIFSTYIWPSSFKSRAITVTTLLSIFLAKVFQLSIPFFYKELINFFTHTTTMTLALVPFGLLLGYVGARVLNVFFSEFIKVLFVKVSQKAVRQIALQIFNHLHKLSLQFHVGRETGALTRTLDRGVKGAETLLTFGVFQIFPIFIETVFTCALLWHFFGAVYVLIIIAMVVAYISFTTLLTNWRMKLQKAVNQADSRSYSRLVDSLLNYETAKYFCNEKLEAKTYDGIMQDYEKTSAKYMSTLSILNFGQSAIISIGTFSILAIVSYHIIHNSLTVGDFVMINTYLMQLTIPLNFLGSLYREFKRSMLNMAEMFQLLDIEQDVQDKHDAVPLTIKDGSITFENVSFAYPQKENTLQNLSFHIDAYKTVAIVGASGAGKSTLSRLLFRFYDPKEGRILIDNQDIKHVTQESLRQIIGIVPQDTVLFNDSIRYNLSYAKADASEDDIIDAAKKAQIHDFIMSLPQGYDTEVGERGLKLSGGEKQRLAIARIFLKNPQILVFDEATSALDLITEKNIQESLKEASQNRTTIIIAHRLSTITHADMIIVMDKGNVVEAGKHTELLQKGATYAQLWQSQTNHKDI